MAARKHKAKRVENWEDINVGVMKRALLQKFSQHKDLRELLLKTGNKDLVEHTAKDKFWGDGGGLGLGQNMLGQLLM